MDEINNQSQEVIYTFHFTDSNQRLQLEQKQLDCVPYLSALVTHKDDFLSIQNSNGEYLLNPPIHFNWLMAVLHSILSKRAYSLLNELPEDENILDTIQLFDYLGLNSFGRPLLEEEFLYLSNPPPTIDGKQRRRVRYHQANVVEARNTAAEFILAVSNNVYDLLDLYTVDNIFSLILIILSRADVFSSRFRHHTLTIVKEYCWTCFSKTQQRQVLATHQMTQRNRKLNSLMYLYDDNNPLPKNFSGAFSWKGDYISIEKKKDVDRQSTDGQRRVRFTIQIDNDYLTEYHNMFWHFPVYEYTFNRSLFSNWSLGKFRFPIYSPKRVRKPNLWLQLRSSIGESNLSQLSPFLRSQVSSLTDKPDDKEFHIDEIKQEQKKNEAKSAQSQRFNKLPKQANIDKFKPRSGPKAQKYR